MFSLLGAMASAQSSNPLTGAEGDRPPFEERFFRDDLPGVRDEPEQDGGVWIVIDCANGRG